MKLVRSTGVTDSLAVDAAPPSLKVDWNVPDQVTNNRCRNECGSACGPYTWAIIKELVLYIVECKEDNFNIDEGELQMTKEFSDACG